MLLLLQLDNCALNGASSNIRRHKIANYRPNATRATGWQRDRETVSTQNATHSRYTGNHSFTMQSAAECTQTRTQTCVPPVDASHSSDAQHSGKLS